MAGEMELIPSLEIGWLNGWILLCLLYLIYGVFLTTFPKQVRSKLFYYDRSHWNKKKRNFYVMGRVSVIVYIVLIIFTPLKIGANIFIPGITLFVLGLVGFIIALFNFKNLSSNQPATKGLYKISRHPQILMLFIASFGICIAIASWSALLILIISKFFGHFRTLAEEETCLEQYGDLYRNYMKSIPRYLMIKTRMENDIKQTDIDKIYRNMSLEEIPWNVAEPPKALVELVENEKVKRCKTIDLGCGAGNYAIYLANKGFNVSGIDISPAAIKIAKENAEKKGVKCDFHVGDVLGDLTEVKETFDFAYDWELLHHIYPQKRKKYVENVYRILNSRGRYFSVCFSEKDPQFEGSGKYRVTPLGTILYFSSEDELRDLFDPYFNINELKTIEIKGKAAPHLVNYVFMEKK